MLRCARDAGGTGFVLPNLATSCIIPLAKPLFIAPNVSRQLRDGAVPRDRAPPSRQRAALVAIEASGFGIAFRITRKVVTSLQSRHADAADQLLRVGDDHGQLAQHRLAARVAQRRNDPIDVPVSIRGGQRLRRKAVTSCVVAGAGLAGSRPRTCALVSVVPVRR